MKLTFPTLALRQAISCPFDLFGCLNNVEPLKSV